MINLDPWQKEVLNTEGNICLCSGRQVGKSMIIAWKSAEAAIKKKSSILIISFTERQAEELFIKVLNYMNDTYPNFIKKGKDRPTKHELRLKNGSVIRCLPTGINGQGIRGYTIDILIADEAAQIPTAVFDAVTPALLTTGGTIILVSTPQGRVGYFYKAFSVPEMGFKTFHINSEDCINNRAICDTWTELTKAAAIKFRGSEKVRMSRITYAQEYLGMFVEELSQYFTDELIQKVTVLQKIDETVIPANSSILQDNNAKNYMGSDLARMGEDQSVFVILQKIKDKKLVMKHITITEHSHLTDSIRLIKDIDKKYNCRRIYLDASGLGAGVYDVLLEDEQTKRKIEAIENAKRSLDRDKTQKVRLMKQDLYTNLLRLMEQGDIELFDDPEIALSLRSVQYEYGDDGKLRIFGNYTHIAEALVRAAWSIIGDKTLNIWIR